MALRTRLALLLPGLLFGCGEPAEPPVATVVTTDAQAAADPSSDSSAADVGSSDTGQADAGEPVDTHKPNSPPVAQDDVLKQPCGEAIHVNATYNDSDPDGDLLKIKSVTQGKHGIVEIIYGKTTILYTPLKAGFTGVDTFTYVVTDGNGGEDTATVTIGCQAVPTLKITSPADNAVLLPDQATAAFEVTGCNVSTPSQDKEGCHLHRYLDGKAWSPKSGGGAGQYTVAVIPLTNMSKGKHTLTLRLHKNDGSDKPWQPQVIDAVKFELK